MLKTYLIICLSMISLVVLLLKLRCLILLANGDAQAGAELVATCAACHGAQGQSINSDWPSLAGQNQRYINDQLKYFQQGTRENALMMAVIPYLKLLQIPSFWI